MLAGSIGEPVVMAPEILTTSREPESTVTALIDWVAWLPVQRDHITAPAPVVQVPESIVVQAPPV
jgi:hypothetical protein